MRSESRPPPAPVPPAPSAPSAASGVAASGVSPAAGGSRSSSPTSASGSPMVILRRPPPRRNSKVSPRVTSSSGGSHRGPLRQSAMRSPMALRSSNASSSPTVAAMLVRPVLMASVTPPATSPTPSPTRMSGSRRICLTPCPIPVRKSTFSCWMRSISGSISVAASVCTPAMRSITTSGSMPMSMSACAARISSPVIPAPIVGLYTSRSRLMPARPPGCIRRTVPPLLMA